MGGMAAFIPTRDPETNDAALAKVRADKRREATAGYDGSWVAHPGLVAICAEEFDAVLGDRPNQLDRQRPDAEVGARELLDVASAGGVVTEAGVRGNVSVSLRYLVAWLSGNGAAALDNLMEDAATVEISRSQLWQWIRHGTTTDSGVVITREHVTAVLDEEFARLAGLDGAELTRLAQARDLFARVALAEDYLDFLTVPAYEEYDRRDARALTRRLGPDDLAAVERIMAPADEALARGYPGDPGTRQPVHTVYVPGRPGAARDRATVRRGRPGLARGARTRPGHLRGRRRRRPGAGGRGLAVAARQARARAGRGPADRPRGRLPRALRRRGGRGRRGGRRDAGR